MKIYYCDYVSYVRILNTIMEFLRLSKDTLVNWSLLPQVELVSDSEDDVEVATAKV